MKIFLFAIGTLVLAFMAENAWADDKHHHDSTTNTESTNGTALAIATSALIKKFLLAEPQE